MRSSLHRGRPAGLGASAAAAWLMLAPPAMAQLGGAAAGVEADRAKLSATLTAAASAGYVTDTLTLPNSTVVREFVGADGEVFAVSWRGPGRPDLRQLLGSYFDQMQAGHPPHSPRRRTPLAMGRGDIVIHTGGHPGVFWGAAYLPPLVPADFPRSAFQ